MTPEAWDLLAEVQRAGLPRAGHGPHHPPVLAASASPSRPAWPSWPAAPSSGSTARSTRCGTPRCRRRLDAAGASVAEVAARLGELPTTEEPRIGDDRFAYVRVAPEADVAGFTGWCAEPGLAGRAPGRPHLLPPRGPVEELAPAPRRRAGRGRAGHRPGRRPHGRRAAGGRARGPHPCGGTPLDVRLAAGLQRRRLRAGLDDAAAGCRPRLHRDLTPPHPTRRRRVRPRRAIDHRERTGPLGAHGRPVAGRAGHRARPVDRRPGQRPRRRRGRGRAGGPTGPTPSPPSPRSPGWTSSRRR